MSDPKGSKTTEVEREGGSAASRQTPKNDQGPENHEAPVEEAPTEEVSVEEPPVRAQQPEDAYLVKMPSEIILSIAKHMDRQSLRSLALTSSRLHNTVRAEFYRSFNYETYRLALKTGDYDQIQRCIAHNAAPADVTWGREHEEPARPAYRNRRDLLYYFDHKPINYLDFAFQAGKFTVDQCLSLLQWLLENGGDIATTWADFDSMYPTSIGKMARFNGKMNHIPHYFIIALLKETDRTKLKGAASIICYLSDQGFNFPREIPPFELTLPRWSRSREDYLEFIPMDSENSIVPMMWMMGSARPLSVLEAFLEQLWRQGATLTSPIEKCPEVLRYAQDLPCGPDASEYKKGTLMTFLWELVEQLYDDLLDPLKWRPRYDGEVGDIWEAKLNLLDRYQGMDEYERPYLVSILASVRKVEDKIRAQGVSVVRRNAKACWLELMETLPSTEEKSAIPMDSFPGICRTDRVHRFSLEYRIDAEDWWDQCKSASFDPPIGRPNSWVEEDWRLGD